MHGIFNETLKVGHFSHCSVGRSSHNPRGRGIRLCPLTEGASLVAQLVKNLYANAEDTRDIGLIPGLGRSPGEGNGNHFFTTNCSGILGWKIPWTELTGGYGAQDCKESDMPEHACIHTL